MAPLLDVLSLQRYLGWSEQMRQHFARLLENGVAISMRTKEGQEMFCYLAYWYAGLCAVVEGWRELKLVDPTIDGLLASPNIEHLRRFRHGAFHYQRDYFDRRFLEITEAAGSARWVCDLGLAFDAWLAVNLPILHQSEPA